jgi:hypothetical protein
MTMRNLIRNPYVIGFLFLLPFSLGFVLFHVYTTNITRNNLETIVELEREHLASEVTSYFNDISGTLETLSRHLEIYGTDNFMSALVAARDDNPSLASIYYLDTDNAMINASGYVPDPSIDFRTLPNGRSMSSPTRSLETRAISKTVKSCCPKTSGSSARRTRMTRPSPSRTRSTTVRHRLR